MTKQKNKLPKKRMSRFVYTNPDQFVVRDPDGNIKKKKKPKKKKKSFDELLNDIVSLVCEL
jgi:hypothetical protein